MPNHTAEGQSLLPAPFHNVCDSSQANLHTCLCKPSPPQAEIIFVLYAAPAIRGIAPEFADTVFERCD